MNNTIINLYREWEKWLSYEPQFQKEKIEKLMMKNNSQLTTKEIDELMEYKTNKLNAELFRSFISNECSKEQIIRVLNYMRTSSIELLMLSKLSYEELLYAKESIKSFSEMPVDKLNEKIHHDQQIDVYNNLAMVDCYILHVVSLFDYTNSLKNLEKKIEAIEKSKNLKI